MDNIFTTRRNKILLLIFAFITLLIISYFSIILGFLKTSFSTLIEALTNFNNSQEHIILLTSRIPRTINAILVGSALSVSGLTLQSLTKNPLSSPSVLGVNSGAALFLVLFLTSFPSLSWSMLSIIAFLGALFTCIVVFLMAGGLRGQVIPLDLTLSGSAIGALFFSLTQGILYKHQTALEEVLFWMTGSVEGKSLNFIVTLAPFILILLILILFLGKSFNLFSLGEEMASSLGMNTFGFKILVLFITAILCGLSVTLAGPISFIGLITPHIVKKFIGSDFRWLLPFSALLGSIILVLSDLLSRFIIYPKELPVGAVTALIGGPFFIYLSRKGNHND
ncbi:siderophore ABC transporter permease [Clostridium zeae]|uniref:Siderophore ABC transporter permease n=1 Tax=Clostridium zeae TaxID=2759022 RepID=A0ABQ1EHT6_9CLOT|nr:iron ABC transporter permease [Clostridium zeae]GFZ34387.1 siderophore ABC transporter permease [Clostridium zeae]